MAPIPMGAIFFIFKSSTYLEQHVSRTHRSGVGFSAVRSSPDRPAFHTPASFTPRKPFASLQQHLLLAFITRAAGFGLRGRR